MSDPADDTWVLAGADARLDIDRARRTGDPEVVFGQGKTPEQIVEILGALHEAHPDRAVLATRLDDAAIAAVSSAHPTAVLDQAARTASLGPLPEPHGDVVVVTAGTSDLPVAREALVTLVTHGAAAELVTDVGVAGLHRVLAVRDRLAAADCLIVVAGMEGALASVVGGLVGVPVVAVPTSVGYGSSFEGLAALLAMLNSCAPGVTVVNIDNGYGAGVAAARIVRLAGTAGPMIGWVDAGAGASGDMLLGALVGAGVPVEVLQTAIDAVTPEPVTLEVEQVRRGGLVATRCHVEVADSTMHRTWADVRALLDAADLAPALADRSRSVFERLAVAEAAVHGTSADEVHFHEVGALDAIADVVGVCAGLEHLGLDRLVVSPVAVGSGRVRAAHGSMPVPVPAVTELLRGVPSLAGPAAMESCTPTGAALLVTHAAEWGAQPAMAVAQVGLGAGSRDPETHANVVRLLVGEPAGAGASDEPWLLETNLDDLDPRLLPGVLKSLLSLGALDAWLAPIIMKKGRPAHTLSVLVAGDLVEAARDLVFTETTTLGIRETRVQRAMCDRSFEEVELGGHPIRVKVATWRGRRVNVQPEFDDVVAAASALGRPVVDVLAEAAAAARS